MSYFHSCFLWNNSADKKYCFLGWETGSYSNRGLIGACGQWCWMFGLLSMELLFHNSVCDFPTLSFSNNNCCFCIWSYTTKKCRNIWKTMAGEWWSGSEQGRWFREAPCRGACSDSLRARGEGLGSFSSCWALWLLLQMVFMALNETRCKKNNLVEYQSTARNNGQWRLSVSSFTFSPEALCSCLGGLLISPCALVPNSSLGSHENTWKDEWKRPWVIQYIFTHISLLNKCSFSPAAGNCLSSWKSHT